LVMNTARRQRQQERQHRDTNSICDYIYDFQRNTFRIKNDSRSMTSSISFRPFAVAR
jgi:hypothetical protein